MATTSEHEHAIAPPPHKKSHAGFLVLLLVVGVVLAAAVVYELGIRKTEDKTLASTLTESATHAPVVNVGTVHIAPAQQTIEFPCQTVAMVETPVYARADGYIKARPVD